MQNDNQNQNDKQPARSSSTPGLDRPVEQIRRNALEVLERDSRLFDKAERPLRTMERLERQLAMVTRPQPGSITDDTLRKWEEATEAITDRFVTRPGAILANAMDRLTTMSNAITIEMLDRVTPKPGSIIADMLDRVLPEFGTITAEQMGSLPSFGSGIDWVQLEKAMPRFGSALDWDQIDRVIAQQTRGFDSLIDRERLERAIAQRTVGLDVGQVTRPGERRLVEPPGLPRVRFEPARFEQLVVRPPVVIEPVELEPVAVPADELRLSELSGRVVAWLAEHCPRAVERLLGARDALHGSGHDAPAHVLLGCRRTIEAVADALYPPCPPETCDRDLSGNRLEVGPNAYRNRLMLVIGRTSLSGKYRAVLRSSLNDLLERLTDEYGKGVHHDALEAEAEQAYYLTVFVIAQLNQTVQS